MEKRKNSLARWLLILGVIPLMFGSLKAQCTGGTFGGTVSPTVAWQTIPCIKGGEYYTFTANAGTYYTFSFCMGGGGAAFNTQITILDNAGVPAVGGFADDECAPGDHLWYWTPPVTGTYRVLVTAFPCTSFNQCATLAYKTELNPYSGPGLNCGNPWVIPSIPYTQGGLTSCYYGNDYNSTQACNSTYIDGEDFVMQFNGNAGECISIFTSNTFIYTGMFLLDGCPSSVGTNCITYHEASGGNPQLSNITLPTTGTYYIVISMEGSIAPGCTPFDISVTPCVAVGVGLTCANAFTVPSLPYSQVGFTTCGYGDDYSSASACGSTYMDGDDFVFAYNSPGNECIGVEVSGSQPWTGFFVLDDCPDAVGANCIASREEPGGNPKLRNINLVNPGTYYIVVSTWPAPQCTQFNIEIDRCPPPCSRNSNANDNCGSSTLVSMGLSDTICGYSNFNFTPDVSVDLDNDFCGSIENNSWFSFVADSTSMTISFEVSNCLSGFGIQAMVLETSDCINYTPRSNCWNPMVEANGILFSSGLVVGNTYYIMIDGYAADDCEFIAYRLGGGLPIEWAGFSANVVDKEDVQIDWASTSEVNSLGYYVQRGHRGNKPSNDDFEWETINYQPSVGDPQNGANYTYTDTPPYTGQSWYYRVQQVDINGTSSFSDYQRVEISGPETSDLRKVYPNPARDRVSLEFYANASGKTSFSLYSLSGMLVKNEIFDQAGQGIFHESIDLKDLSSGLYIYMVSINGEYFKGRIDIQK